MKVGTFAAALASVIGAGACVPQSEGPAPSCAERATLADEYKILSAALNYCPGCDAPDPATALPLALLPTTSSSLLTDDDRGHSNLELSETPPSADVVDDLIARSEVPIEIDPAQLKLERQRLVIVDPEDVPFDAPQGTPPWDEFEAQYGTASVHSISRPGIGCGEAVVAQIRTCGELCAAAFWLILIKTKNGRWDAAAEVGAWQS